MFGWLKKHFIPHAGNVYRPHFLRGKNARRIAVLIIAVELVVFLLPSLANVNLSGNLAAVISAVLDNLTNTEREAQNLPTLAVSPKLTAAAQMKAEDMAAKSYFAHTSPEGKTPWYWLEFVGYKYQYAGENLAVNFSDSEDVTKAWLESPTHKANIVKGNYTEMGTGIARGIYKGSNTVFVAQVYANPMPEALPFPVTLPIRTVEAAPTPASPDVTSGERVGVLGTATEATPPVEQNTVEGPTLSQKLLASPRNTANTLLVIIFVAVAIALILYAAIKVRGHHLDIIGNGLLLLAIIGAILVANYYFSYRKLITTSTDYSREENIDESR